MSDGDPLYGAWGAAHLAERAQRATRRTAEATEQITAARAAPTGIEVAMQELETAGGAAPPLDPGTWIRSIDGSWRRAPEVSPDDIVLSGPEAGRYRALLAAARAATEATRVVKATSEALRDAFQQFCAGITPDKEP